MEKGGDSLLPSAMIHDIASLQMFLEIGATKPAR